MAHRPASLTRRATEWTVDRLARALVDRALAMPYERRVPFMGAALRRIAPIIGYQRRALEQLRFIYPDWTEAQRSDVADAVADNAGRTLIETYSGPEFTAQIADTPVVGPGLAALATARDAGRPVILVTGHFGNHEAPRHILTARGYTIGGLYRPMRNPGFNQHYVETLAPVSGPIFPQGRQGTMGFARFLKSGGIGVLLFDVWAKGGAEIPFLGQPALTATSAADLALRYNAALIPVFARRAPDGLSFAVEMDAPIPPSDPLTMTQAASDALEVRIRQTPEQWFWFHRRWKPERRRRG